MVKFNKSKHTNLSFDKFHEMFKDTYDPNEIMIFWLSKYKHTSYLLSRANHLTQTNNDDAIKTIESKYPIPKDFIDMVEYIIRFDFINGTKYGEPLYELCNVDFFIDLNDILRGG